MQRERPEPHRVLGCLLGGALGDALGYQVEFVRRGEIERRFGPGAPERLAYAGGTHALISDDTQMSLFVADGIIRAEMGARRDGTCDPVSLGMNALMRWYATQTGVACQDGWLVGERRLHVRRAPGMTIMSALGQYAQAGARGAREAHNDSKGCGTVMRAAPFGFLAERAAAFERAAADARLTHGHPTGALAAGYLAAAVWGVARGEPVAEALAAADGLTAGRPGCAETLAAVESARQVAARRPLAFESLGGGWIAEEALAFGVAAALAFDGGEPRAVEEMLWGAACHDGDSDSTAAIAGNLIGAVLGAGGLPAAWLEELELREVVERVAVDLWTAVVAGEDVDLGDYPPV